MPEDEKKCEHPSCHCPAKEGSDFCGAYCEGLADTPEVQCACGHPECEPVARV